MHVYRVFTINLGKAVPFKDTLAFVEQFLHANGLSYRQIRFSFSEHDKLTEQYPQLAPFYRKDPITGLSRYSNFLADMPPGREPLPLDSALIREIVRKIPRPLNIFFSTVTLGDIDWFGERTPPALIGLRMKRPCRYSSSITLRRISGCGLKYNPLDFEIDITDTAHPGELLDDTDWLQKIAACFGSCKTHTVCRFDEEEAASWALAEQQAEQALKPFWDTVDGYDFPRDSTDYTNILQRVMDIEAIPPMSMKKTAIAVFKPLGYRYISGRDQCHILRKLDGYHHAVEIQIVRTPNFKHVEPAIYLRGHNFSMSHALPCYTPFNQEQLDSVVSLVARAAEYIEKSTAEPLYQHFGATPEWYAY